MSTHFEKFVPTINLSLSVCLSVVCRSEQTKATWCEVCSYHRCVSVCLSVVCRTEQTKATLCEVFCLIKEIYIVGLASEYFYYGEKQTKKLS